MCVFLEEKGLEVNFKLFPEVNAREMIWVSIEWKLKCLQPDKERYFGAMLC